MARLVLYPAVLTPVFSEVRVAALFSPVFSEVRVAAVLKTAEYNTNLSKYRGKTAAT
jgi:hypothetical protein